MTDIEHLLRTTLDEQAAEAPQPRPGIFDDALAAQRTRRRHVAGVVAAVIAVGGITVGATSLGHSPGGGDVAASAVGAAEDVAPGMSVAEQQAQLAIDMQIADPPTVPVIRLVVPGERGQLVDACMGERGWATGEDAISEVPSDRAEAYDLDTFVCAASYPVDPARAGTWTDAQTAVQYDWTVDTLLPCLGALGYTVTEPPPSRADFIADWWTDPYFPFAHIEGIDDLGNQRFAQLEAQCPQQAPTDQLWD